MIASTSIAGKTPAGDGVAEDRDEAEPAVQPRLECVEDERAEHVDAPEPDDDARHGGEHVDQRADRAADRRRRELAQEEADRDRERAPRSGARRTTVIERADDVLSARRRRRVTGFQVAVPDERDARSGRSPGQARLGDLPDDQRDRRAARAARRARSARAARGRRAGRRRRRVRRRPDGRSGGGFHGGVAFQRLRPAPRGPSPLRHRTFTFCAPRPATRARRDSVRVSIVEPPPLADSAGPPLAPLASWPRLRRRPIVDARPVFDIQDLVGVLRQVSRGQGRHAGDLQERDHRADRPFRLRQVDLPALPQPDERSRLERRIDGKLLYHGTDLYGPGVDPIEVRRRIGMVFQRPNPFPKSIYDNVAYGLRILGMKDNLDDRVEQALKQRRDLGRGQEPAQALCARPLRRPAAAALHRPRDRRRARRRPARRARLRARPDLDAGDRGPDARAEAATTRSSSSRTTCSRRRASPR